MTERFHLNARIDTDAPAELRPVLEDIAGSRGATLTVVRGGFELQGEWIGSSARDLNRALLSELRRTVRRTRLRSEWTHGSETERFFDYVPKGRTRAPAG